MILGRIEQWARKGKLLLDQLCSLCRRGECRFPIAIEYRRGSMGAQGRGAATLTTRPPPRSFALSTPSAPPLTRILEPRSACPSSSDSTAWSRRSSRAGAMQAAAAFGDWAGSGSCSTRARETCMSSREFAFRGCCPRSRRLRRSVRGVPRRIYIYIERERERELRRGGDAVNSASHGVVVGIQTIDLEAGRVTNRVVYG